jgi:hypothetical protein
VAYCHNGFFSRIDIDNGGLVVPVLYNARDLDVEADAVGWLGALLIVVCTIAIFARAQYVATRHSGFIPESNLIRFATDYLFL